jgi:4-amino-4-deoxy-L-arabinose transferase-like glycosyltransferase
MTENSASLEAIASSPLIIADNPPSPAARAMAWVSALIALGLAANGAAILSTTGMIPTSPVVTNRADLIRALLWLAASIPMFWAALALLTTEHPDDTFDAAGALPDTYADEDYDPLRRWWHRLGLIIGIVMLIFMGDLSARILHVENWLPFSEHFQFTMLVVGSILVAWGLAGGFRWTWGGVTDEEPAVSTSGWRFWHLLRDRPMDIWLDLTLMVALLAIALLLRATILERAIPGFVDEVSFTFPLPAFDFSDEIRLMQPINSVAAFPRLYIYWEWISIRLLGQDLNAFRLPSAILGALTIPALYWLCKHLFDRRVAFVAALVLAALPVHLQMSRVGMNNVADPLFGTLAFAFVARGLRYGGRTNYAIAGVMLGWTQFFHEAGRLTLPVIMLVWMVGVWVWTWWRRQQAGRRRPGHLGARFRLVVIAALLTSIPYYYTVAAMGGKFAARVGDVGLRPEYWQSQAGLSSLLEGVLLRAQGVLTRLLHNPERILYYAGTTPYIHYLLTPFLVLGLAYALWRWRRPGGSLVLLWTLLPLGAIIVLLAEVMSPRITVFMPALAILIALGVVHITHALIAPAGVAAVPLDRLSLAAQRVAARWSVAAVVLALALSISMSVYYFGTHLPSFRRQMYILQPWQQFIFDVRSLPANAEIHTISQPRFDETYLSRVIAFTGGGGQKLLTHAPEDISAEMLALLPRTQPLVFIVQMPMDQSSVLDAQLRAVFPNIEGAIISTEPRIAPTWFNIYLVPTPDTPTVETRG